jgi:hypothetical protein
MTTLFISEYAALGKGDCAQEPSVTTQTIAIGGTSAQSAVFNDNTNYVRLHAAAVCSVAFGDNPTATATTARLNAGQTEYFGVVPGQRVAVITNS